jgi:glutamate carboxypeptidase
MSEPRDLERAEQIMDSYLADLQAIVNIDSGTYTPAGINRVGAYLAKRFQDWGFATHFDKQTEYGDHLLATRQGKNPAGARLLLVGHIDTVFSEGEVARRPFALSERNGFHIATGPGVLDMKSGVLIGMYALNLLSESDEDTYQSVTFICNSDEEVGSPSSKPLIRELASQHDAVLVFEPGRKEEAVVSARKGCGHYKVEVWGRSAHAGVEPHMGRNAILELAHQVQKLQAINGTIPGVTVNVGIIRGGERTNVVPDYAYCELDVRAADQAGIRAVEKAMRDIATQHMLDSTKITVSGSMGIQPFLLNDQNLSLLNLVRAAGTELGLEIHDLSTGGASDANTTSATGTPTLDGLGAGGGLAHNPDEYIELDYLPKRIALVMGLIKRIDSKKEQ